MKKIVLIALFLFAGSAAFSQAKDYTKIPLKTVEDCKKAEGEVMEACKLIMKKPLNDVDQAYAILFILAWSEKTEYTLIIDKNINSLSKKKANALITGVFLAAEIIYILDNPDKAKNTKEILINTYTDLAE